MTISFLLYSTNCTFALLLDLLLVRHVFHKNLTLCVDEDVHSDHLMLMFMQVNMLTNKLHPCTLTSMAEDGSIYPDLRSRLASDLRRISRY